MESRVSYREVSDLPENVFIKDVITSETHHVASNQPAKKQTRQWAAWTRQEEESFFNALRQVGKNFEKITSCVQSKNKDQVRHYYYRLVRRMNKLLGPQLSLDAKNSKDTIAAMLRWWSLLEKHSCKASKLHLKPRRFKIFLETLEHQLLKDRKKSIRKRLVDSQNTQNLGSGKGSSSLRLDANTCLDQINSKRDLSSVKSARKRRRSVAYKRWEKAAMAGVSLVADAAVHLEQTALDKLVDTVQYMQGDEGRKLKLQLFPINESMRRVLEMENHNPHLELTLSSRKKISSVLEHMNRKWGSSSVASGELTLLPYYAQSLNLTSCQKWTRDSAITAADVYAAIGSPSVFRLRYGWFLKTKCRYAPVQEPPSTLAGQRINMNGVEGSHKNAAVSILEWADSLTNISVGDLLSDVSHNINSNCIGSRCLQQIPFSSDSFDAAIAAHINPTVVSSIWDAEETRDAFTFHKHNLLSEKAHNSKEDSVTSLVPSGSVIEKLAEAEEPMEDYHAQEHSMDECESDGNPEDGSRKDLQMLGDMYWPESLGPLEVNLPTCRYQSHDLILSDSLSGLARILTSSLDAFQNCSFFGLEQREAVGDQQTASFPDHKTDSQVSDNIIT